MFKYVKLKYSELKSSLCLHEVAHGLSTDKYNIFLCCKHLSKVINSEI